MAFPVQAREGACDSLTRSPAAAARLNPSGKNDSGVAWMLLGCTVRRMRCAALPWRSTLVCDDNVVKASRCDTGAVVTVKNQCACSMSDGFAHGAECKSAHVRSMSSVSHRCSMQVASTVALVTRRSAEMSKVRCHPVSRWHRQNRRCRCKAGEEVRKPGVDKAESCSVFRTTRRPAHPMGWAPLYAVTAGPHASGSHARPAPRSTAAVARRRLAPAFSSRESCARRS